MPVKSKCLSNAVNTTPGNQKKISVGVALTEMIYQRITKSGGEDPFYILDFLVIPRAGVLATRTPKDGALNRISGGTTSLEYRAVTTGSGKCEVDTNAVITIDQNSPNKGRCKVQARYEGTSTHLVSDWLTLIDFEIRFLGRNDEV